MSSAPHAPAPRANRRQIADVVIVGFGAAGACAAIDAHDTGSRVIVLEKQNERDHYSNTRMSGGSFHSPRVDGDPAALKEYAKAMFSGENLPLNMRGEQTPWADDFAELWARHAPQNADFLQNLDRRFQTAVVAGAAFEHFPGARDSGYAVVASKHVDDEQRGASVEGAQVKQYGEALHACLLHGLRSREIPTYYGAEVSRILADEDGAIIGVEAQHSEARVEYLARRAVVLASGGYEYSRSMREAFLDGPGVEGWAFYGSPANTGDGLRMALRAGAALTKAGRIAGRIICAIPERRHGLKLGLNTPCVGRPNEIVVDNYGRRYADETRVTTDPSRYIFYREALQFDAETRSYPRIPSWMVFDSTLMKGGPLVSVRRARYHGIDWGEDNLGALRNGWVLQGGTLEELGERIRGHDDNRRLMEPMQLAATAQRWNEACRAGSDRDFARKTAPSAGVEAPPFFAIPLYPGGPNTLGGLRANSRRQVVDWENRPIPRLYAAGEIASVFQFAYQSGGNLGECVTFGRIAGANAASESARSL